MADTLVDPQVFGHRLRHFRRARDLTLRELGERVGKPASYLSMLENGRREPRLTLLQTLAGELGVEVGDLLEAEAPDRRSGLELAFERAQRDPLYRELGLPPLSPSARLPDEALEHLVALAAEVRRLNRPEVATPEEARQANAALRAEMRRRENYFGEIEAVAREARVRAGHADDVAALSQRGLIDVCQAYGFTVNRVQDLPHSVRSISDLAGRRIYIRQRDALGTEDARTVVLQTNATPRRDVMAPPVPVMSGETSPLWTLGWLSVGVGVAALNVGAVTGIVAIEKSNDLDAVCPNGQCPTSAEGDLDTLKTLSTVSTVGFVAAGVGVGVGIAMLLASPSARAPASQGSITPWVGAGSAGLSGTF